MNSRLYGIATLAIAGALALGGCATTGSVKRAQARADEAYGLGESAGGAAGHAQGSADAAMTAAQRAQAAADAAGQNAQAANAAAAGYAQSSSGQYAAMNDRLRHLERQVHQLRGREHGRHHGHHKSHWVKGQVDQPARFHN